MTSETRTPPFAHELAHPFPVAALVVLAVNDHLLKGVQLLPGWLTGKLSDFAGLFLFPILLFVLADAFARACSRGLPRRAAAIVCSASTALAFAACKLHPALNVAVSAYWGPMVPDATDLIALPMCVAAAAWLIAPARAGSAPHGLRYALVIAASIFCAATSRAPFEVVRNYPAWQFVDHSRHTLGCASLDAWVSKSGKQGVGITLEFPKRGADPCEVAVQQASFHIAGRKVNAVALPPAFSLDEWPRHVYLAFEFDNNESWNRYELDATLDLTLSVAGATSRVSRRLAHRWSGPHKTVSTLDRPPPPPASDGGVPPDAASARGAP